LSIPANDLADVNGVKLHILFTIHFNGRVLHESHVAGFLTDVKNSSSVVIFPSLRIEAHSHYLFIMTLVVIIGFKMHFSPVSLCSDSPSPIQGALDHNLAKSGGRRPPGLLLNLGLRPDSGPLSLRPDSRPPEVGGRPPTLNKIQHIANARAGPIARP